jgi:hypothetical protein
MPKPLVWVKIKTGDATAPTARLGHTLVEMDKDVYVLYGGLDINSRVEGNIIPNSQVYTLRINQRNEYVWILADCDGEEIPLPRTNHAACKISKNEMFVFGGYYTSKKRFNDVHILKTNPTGKLSFFLTDERSAGQPTRLFAPSDFFGYFFRHVLTFRQEVYLDTASKPKAFEGHS